MRRHSPFNYVFDNPIRFIDPDGMSPFGDFLDGSGKKLGTDGKKDGKVYVVADQTEAIEARRKGKTGQKLDGNKIKSKVLLATFGQRQEMGKAVDRANAPSEAAGDEKGGWHEEGGYYGKDKNGNEIVVDAKPGKAGKEGDPGIAIDPLDPLDGKENHKGDEIEGTFHVHPSAGGNGDPVPSTADKKNAVKREGLLGIKGNNYVLSPEYNKVYVYKNVNGVGKTIATLPLDVFRTYKAE